MTKPISVVTVLFAVSVTAWGQSSDSQLRRDVGAQLEATATILKSDSCLDRPSIVFGGRRIRTDLTLELTFTNTGNYPIILRKESAQISGEAIAHTLSDAQSGKYEVKDWAEFGYAGPAQSLGDRPDRTFVILQPGESYERQSTERLLTERLLMYDTDRFPEYRYTHFTAQPHFIQFFIRTYGESIDESREPNELRHRWLSYGYLWLEGALSQPTPIQFPASASLTRCQ